MGEFTVVGLRVVREAARHGSFSTAAEKLGYTQSAVSRQIALMEQAAGRSLFERRARGVRPTEAGRLVVRRADAVLGELQATRQDLHDLGARASGRLRVGAFSTAMAALVPRAIAAYAGRAPGVQVPLREGVSPGLLSAFARGRVDLVVVNPPQRPLDGVELIPLLDDPMFIAMGRGHALATSTRVTTAELRDERWIVGSSEPDSTLLGALNDSAWRPDIAFVARDWIAKLGLVAAGLGVTVVPGLAVPALPATIAVVRIDDPAAVRPTAVAHRPNGHGDTFVEALRDAAADLSVEVRHRLR